jgi:hypothetical protein
MTSARREQETQDVEAAPPDPFDWSDPVSRTAWDFADSAPFPNQATAMDLQRIWHRDTSSADHRCVNGQLERAKKQSSVRGLNRNCNHDLKNLFKGAAIVASSKPGPFQEFCIALLAKGIKPEMARLTLARKIATIVLMVWKRGACFDPTSETTNSLSVSDRVRSISGDFSGDGRRVLETLWFERESQLNDINRTSWSRYARNRVAARPPQEVITLGFASCSRMASL